MKIIMSLIALSFSLSLLAGSPELCDGRETCVKGTIPIIQQRVMYARGLGRTCDEALRDADEVFKREFGDQSCGLFSGPGQEGNCSVQSSEASVWVQCKPDSAPRGGRQHGCTMLLGSLVCS